MKKNEMPEYSAYIITEYYNNNIQPFLNSFSKDCLWLGPATGQMIRTKNALVEAFSHENNNLTFAMENLQVIPIFVNTTAIDVVLTFKITTYYPNGEADVFNQRIELLWSGKKIKDEQGHQETVYLIDVCHISNEFPYDERDTIYPNHFNELDISKMYAGKPNMCKFALKGLYNSFFYLSGDTIIWMESKGLHTIIKTTDRVYESGEKLSVITKKYPDDICRVHSCYAVNPIYVSQIGRFFVEMQDGKRMNIPEKKYTKTRDEINRRIDVHNQRLAKLNETEPPKPAAKKRRTK